MKRRNDGILGGDDPEGRDKGGVRRRFGGVGDETRGGRGAAEDAQAGSRTVQIVFFSEIKWTYMRTRKQFLLDRLPPSWRVLFMEPFAFGRRNSLTPTRNGRITYVTVPFVRGGTTSSLYNKMVANGTVRRFLSGVCRLWIRALFVLQRIPSSRVFMISNPYAADAALSLSRDLLCYDYNDNPFQFPQTPEWVRTGLERVLKRADLVFVVSGHYLDALARAGVANLHLLGNGVEFEHFAHPRETPRDLAGVPRPLLLYTGRIGPLINMELMAAVAGAFPEGRLLLIGPVDPISRGDLAGLLAAPNVVWMDEKPYEDLPGYIQAADVCLAPFKFMDEYTVGVNPNKIYQYLAAGRPVVSSYIAELEGYSDTMCFSKTTEEFLRGVGRMLSDPPPKEALRDIAKRNDWAVKAEKMASLVSDALGR